MCFPCLHCLGSRLLCQDMSEAGSELHALPMSKPLKFRFSGTPQRRRLVGPAFCALPRCWRAQSLPGGGCGSSPPPSLLLGFLGALPARLFRCAASLLGADLWLRPSRRMSTIQNPKKSWLATKPARSLVEDASLGLRLPASGSGYPCLPVSSRGWAGPQLAKSAQSFVL